MGLGIRFDDERNDEYLNQPKQVDVVEVVRHGDKMIIPESLTPAQAIHALENQIRMEEEEVEINHVIPVFPWEGALALSKAMAKMFGWHNMVPTPDHFGPIPPRMLAVEINYKKEVVRVPWGRMTVPGVDGYIETGVAFREGRYCFQLTGTVKRKHESTIDKLATLTREFVEKESIYRGKAFRIRFRDEDGDLERLPKPEFLDLSQTREGDLVYPKEVEKAIQTNLFTPVERTDDCRRLGIPLKRGVLLTGPYGTGKTLAAYVTAKKACENGWTFIYLERVGELEDAIRFAQQYTPAVIFSEDIDRVVTGERDEDIDGILNTIDGVETKNSELMVVLTTNHVENINQAMLRPGRLDAVINVTPPDAEAVERLIRLYGRGLVDANEDLSEVGRILEGQIPAVIRECVERSKLSAIRLSQPGDSLKITSAALIDAAGAMQMQLNLLKPREQDERSDLEKLGDVLGRHIKAGMKAAEMYYDVNLDKLASAK